MRLGKRICAWGRRSRKRARPADGGSPSAAPMPVFSARRAACCWRRRARARRSWSKGWKSQRVEPGEQGAPVAVAARQQHQAGDQEQDVGQPHRDPGVDPAVGGAFLAQVLHHVVDGDHRDRLRERRGAAARALAEAERERHQAEHQAGGRDRELLVHLDPGQRPGGGRPFGVARPLLELAPAELADLARARPVDRAALGVLVGEGEHLVARDLGLGRRREIELLLDRVAELDFDAAALVLDAHRAGVRHREVGLADRQRVGDEDALPFARPRAAPRTRTGCGPRGSR